VDAELMPMIKELCYIANERNKINLRRHRARYKKQYWSKAVTVTEAYIGSNSELRKLELRGNRQAAVYAIKDRFEKIRSSNPYPKKWMQMGLMKLRSLTLKYEGEYAIAKHQTMEYTFATNERVREILAKINGSITYNNGSISSIRVEKTISPNNFIGYTLTPTQITEYAVQHELDLNIDKILE
jgi:hypothetical protein